MVRLQSIPSENIQQRREHSQKALMDSMQYESNTVPQSEFPFKSIRKYILWLINIADGYEKINEAQSYKGRTTDFSVHFCVTV